VVHSRISRAKLTHHRRGVLVGNLSKALAWAAALLSPSLSRRPEVELAHLGFLRRALGVGPRAEANLVYQEVGTRPWRARWLAAVVRCWNVAASARYSIVAGYILRANAALAVGEHPCWAKCVTDAVEALWAASPADVRAASAEEMTALREDLRLGRPLGGLAAALGAAYLPDDAELGDPRAPETKHRPAASYAAYFKFDAALQRSKATYLRDSTLPPFVRAAAAQLRIGSWRLRVNCGRGTSSSYAERVCLHCHGGVEDALHRLLECPSGSLPAIRDRYHALLQNIAATAAGLRRLSNHPDQHSVAYFFAECLHAL